MKHLLVVFCLLFALVPLGCKADNASVGTASIKTTEAREKTANSGSKRSSSDSNPPEEAREENESKEQEIDKEQKGDKEKDAKDEAAKESASKPAKAKLQYDRTLYQPALVLLEGKEGVGTGFICKIQGIPFLVTNIHVLASTDASDSFDNGLSKLQARTLDGKRLTLLSIFGAEEHDLCIIRFAEEAEYADIALDHEPNVGAQIHVEDDIVIPGNSKGAGTMVWTEGSIVGIGPTRIEHDAPVYEGNSGSPIIHLRSGKVVGVLSYAQPVSINTFVDKKSFNNKRSAIKGDIRYFGYRLDSPQNWYGIHLPQFSRQQKELDDFINRRHSVATFLYTDNEDWRSDRELDEVMNTANDYIRSRAVAGRITREAVIQASVTASLRLDGLIKDDTYRKYTRYQRSRNASRNVPHDYYPYFFEIIEREVKIRDYLSQNIQEWEARLRKIR